MHDREAKTKAARRLFDFDVSTLWGFTSYPVRCFAVSPDGARFYATKAMPRPPTPPVTQVQLVLNWTEELKAKLPTSVR